MGYESLVVVSWRCISAPALAKVCFGSWPCVALLASVGSGWPCVYSACG
jgi:hypothetical protein